VACHVWTVQFVWCKCLTLMEILLAESAARGKKRKHEDGEGN
jgi:hypothetical protein